jgi:hypothetical protein
MKTVCFGIGITLLGIALSMFGSYVIHGWRSKYDRAIVIANSLLLGALAVIFVWTVVHFVAALRS